MGTATTGALALIAGPWVTDMDPTRDTYDATVWLLVVWSVLHVAVGLIMQLYCLARRLMRHLTPTYDIDLANTTLYWHFAVLIVVITVAVIAGFPQLV